MPSDDTPKGITETIAGEAKPVAVEVHKDAESVGRRSRRHPVRPVRLALRPVELLAQGGERTAPSRVTPLR